jgi:hypothetical protein
MPAKLVRIYKKTKHKVIRRSIRVKHDPDGYRVYVTDEVMSELTKKKSKAYGTSEDANAAAIEICGQFLIET